MSRQLRIEYPGALYHVMSHGTGNLWLYKSEKDFQDYLDLLLDVKKKFKFEFHALILMRNHYHFLVETPFANLSKGMNYFNGQLAQHYNRRQMRQGAVFRTRYKAVLIEQEKYYRTVFCYIHQNALRANIVNKVEKYEGGIWYYLERGGTNKVMLNNLISWDSVKLKLGVKSLHRIKLLLNSDLQESPMEGQKYEYFIGSPAWIENIKRKYINSIPKEFNQKTRIEKATSEIWKKFRVLKDYKDHPEYLNFVILILWKYSNLSQSDIATKFNISTSNAVSRRISYFNKKLNDDRKLNHLLNKIESG